jgi:RNA polymerase sigma-70 factor (ECF subfamily)
MSPPVGPSGSKVLEPIDGWGVERGMEAQAITADPVLTRAIHGDPLARRALVLRHGPLVWSICRRLAQDPEDAYQIVWEKALRALERFDPAGPARLSTWLASIAHRQLVDEHRRRVVRGVTVDPDDLEAPEAGEAPADLARLDDAIQALPDGLRRVIVLHHLHGLPLEDIARDEEVPVGTVKSRLHRARAMLAARLGVT